MGWFNDLGLWSVRPFIELSPVAFLGVIVLARYTVDREWRVPWAITIGVERTVCLMRGHDRTDLEGDRWWCARCGREPGKRSPR